MVHVGPLEASYVAVNRHAPGTLDPAFEPSEAISLDDALTSHTLAGARVAGIEDLVGSLR